MPTGAQPPTKGDRTLRFPWAESAYDRLLTERSSAKDRRAALSEECAAWFPDPFPWGSTFCGFPAPSSTPHLLWRRLRLAHGRTVFPIAPALVMPAMTGRTPAVDPAWCCMRLPGPWGAMAHGCGRQARSGSRLAPGLGRCRGVGTTVKHPERCPTAWVAEAQPRGWQGARVAIAPTAAPACLLGASLAPAASQADGAKASGVVARAAPGVEAASAPQTVQTDGGQATPGAWQALCPPMTILLSLLPAWLTIRDRATQTVGEAVAQGPKRGWEA